MVTFTQNEIYSLHFSLLAISLVFFSLALLTGWKWSVMGRTMQGDRYAFLFVGAWFFGGWLYAFDKLTFDEMKGHLIIAFILIILPLLIILVPVYLMVIKEIFKESKFYQGDVIEGRGRETSRLAGFLTFLRRDISSWWVKSKEKIIRTKESPIYLGRTRWIYDYKIGGRDIGLISDQHLITIAGSGAGKSRDVLFNNIRRYNGGMIVFDTKGEHVEKAYFRRREYAPVYVLDPYGKTDGNKVKRNKWNPLAEIDVNSDMARSDLTRITEAIIPKEKSERASDVHFRHIPQIIMRGYLAHIITALPAHEQHLGTLFDLLALGDKEGGRFDPQAMQELVIEMADNNALGGAPAQTAALLSTLSDKEKSSHYSSIIRAIDWMNDPKMRAMLHCDKGSPYSFSVATCKTHDASVFLVLPEKQIYTMSRFLTLFYTIAFDKLDEHETKQPEGSNRRVLFVFDEFEALGTFEPARHAALRKRSSYIKCWFVLQNYQQFKTNYSNVQDFFGNADKQFFGIDASDSELMEIISKALGSYSVEVAGSDSIKTEERQLMSHGRLSKVLDGDRMTQLVIPVLGLPMVLDRIPYNKNY